MLDLIGILLLTFYFFRGWRKGIVVALCSMAGIVLGMLAALKLSGSFAAWLMAHGWVTSAWAQIVSYIILFIGVLWLVRLLAKAVEGALRAAMLGFFNSFAGAVLYVFIGAFIWSCMLWIGSRARIIGPEAIAASHTYAYFEPLAPWVFAHAGAVLPFAKDVFSELEHFFDGVNNHLSTGHVGAH